MKKINELGRNPSNAFTPIRKMKIYSTYITEGSCMTGNDGILYLNEKDRAKLWKAIIQKI